MGKYMKKAKTSEEVAVMEVSHHSGVRTRARTLALQRVQMPPPEAAGTPTQDPFSYLELRSRRLEKLIFSKPKPAVKTGPAPMRNPSPNASSDASKLEGTLENSGSEGSVSLWSCRPKRAKAAPPPLLAPSREVPPENDAGVEVSCGENVLELKIDSCRSARETTPCSLIKDPDAVETLGSTTRPTKSSSSKKRMVQRTTPPSEIPNANDVEEFFTVPEQRQQEIFKKKYNFNPANEEPLAGRYEWVKLNN